MDPISVDEALGMGVYETASEYVIRTYRRSLDEVCIEQVADLARKEKLEGSYTGGLIRELAKTMMEGIQIEVDITGDFKIE